MKCFFCFNDTGKICFDKKERPMYWCSACNHRVFVRSSIGLKAILVWAETAKSFSQQDWFLALDKVACSAVMQSDGVQKWQNAMLENVDVVEKGVENGIQTAS